MILRTSLRGQPLSVLVLILGGWVALRVATWAPPAWDMTVRDGWAVPAPAMPALADKTADAADGRMVAEGFARGPISPPYGMGYPEGMALSGYPAPQPGWQMAGGMPQPVFQQVRIPVPVYYYPASPGAGPADAAAFAMAGNGSGAVGGMTGSGALPAGAGAAVPSPPLAFADPGVPPPFLAPEPARTRGNRWSSDAWVLARRESPVMPASGRPSYGGSQAGAILRYHIAPQNGHRPIAYLRAYSALGSIRENEIALGVGARPFRSVPLMLAVEGRAFRSAQGQTSVRPAVLAYTELPPFALPLGFTGEAYVQGGYVGGMYKTGFADGQLRVDRPLIDVATMQLRAGGGIWAGAQKGAARLDVGPSASTMIDMWGTRSRVSLDWRFRVKGDAEPKSGPAVTISAGF